MSIYGKWDNKVDNKSYEFIGLTLDLGFGWHLIKKPPNRWTLNEHGSLIKNGIPNSIRFEFVSASHPRNEVDLAWSSTSLSSLTSPLTSAKTSSALREKVSTIRKLQTFACADQQTWRGQLFYFNFFHLSGSHPEKCNFYGIGLNKLLEM